MIIKKYNFSTTLRDAMTTLKYSSKGVNYLNPSSDFSPIKGGCEKSKPSAGRQLTASSYPPFKEFKSLFIAKYAVYFQDVSEEDITKILKKTEEIFFAWMFAAQKEKRTSKEFKRMKFFQFAKNELYSHLYGFGLLTQEFLPSSLPPFADVHELVVPVSDCTWMFEQHPPDATSSSIVTYWQPTTSEVPIPTLQETLDLIDRQQETIDGLLASQPLPDSEF